jgi:hypothetical protein
MKGREDNPRRRRRHTKGCKLLFMGSMLGIRNRYAHNAELDMDPKKPSSVSAWQPLDAPPGPPNFSGLRSVLLRTREGAAVIRPNSPFHSAGGLR